MNKTPTLSHPTTLTQKQQQLRQLLSKFTVKAIAVFPSQAKHHRLRAEFRIWHDNDDIYYVMTRAGQKASSETIIHTPQLSTASRAINELMPTLLAHLRNEPILRHRLFQVEFLNTLSGDMLVTLIYHRKLDDTWTTLAKDLSTNLGIHLIGRSRKQKIVLSRDYVKETLHVNGKPYHYHQYEGAFSQPNGEICQQMIAWALEQSANLGGDLLELYCGNGNFTIPLAQNFQRVLATEVSKSSVKALRENITLNAVDNIAVARLSAEEFTQAWRGEREFKRLKQEAIELADYQFSTILVDPPRAGIDAKTLTLLQSFDNIIYISCNPKTLSANLETLCQSHCLAHAALFDQFPTTPHIESGVLLQRRQ